MSAQIPNWIEKLMDERLVRRWNYTNTIDYSSWEAIAKDGTEFGLKSDGFFCGYERGKLTLLAAFEDMHQEVWNSSDSKGNLRSSLIARFILEERNEEKLR